MKNTIAIAMLSAMILPAQAAVINLTDSTANTDLYSGTQSLGVTIDGDSAIYLVTTVTFDTAVDTTGAFNVASFYSGATEAASAGQTFGNSTWGLGGGGKTVGTIAIAADTPTLLVMKLDQTTGTFVLYVDPDLGAAEPGAADVTRTRGTGLVDLIDDVRFRGGNGGTNGNTVAYTSNSVHYAGDSPFNAVPEPSSTALLGLGGLALILRRRK